jgi:hypothetical protein
MAKVTGIGGSDAVLGSFPDAGKLNKHLQRIWLTDGIPSAQIEGNGIVPNRLFQRGDQHE